jgi:hypothetical protein
MAGTGSGSLFGYLSPLTKPPDEKPTRYVAPTAVCLVRSGFRSGWPGFGRGNEGPVL